MPDSIEPSEAWWEGVFSETASKGEASLKSLVRALTRYNVDLEEQLEEAEQRYLDLEAMGKEEIDVSAKCQTLSTELQAALQKLETATAMAQRWQEAANSADRARESMRLEVERATGALASAQREAERWKRAADFLQVHLSAMRLGPTGPTSRPEEKYRRVKALLSKGLHPDNLRGISSDELLIREKIFKELWPQIDRIDRER
ncbi:MAG: hypothetical protein JO001_00160 [Alphaproteobacteria bacterium]|nr:hypothetical protein [Alphaproteobacteria bacterium]